MTQDTDEAMEHSREINKLLISTILKSEIKSRGITRTEIALIAGITREQAGWIVNSKRNPTLLTLLKVLAALNLSIILEKE